MEERWPDGVGNVQQDWEAGRRKFRRGSLYSLGLAEGQTRPLTDLGQGVGMAVREKGG